MHLRGLLELGEEAGTISKEVFLPFETLGVKSISWPLVLKFALGARWPFKELPCSRNGLVSANMSQKGDH